MFEWLKILIPPTEKRALTYEQGVQAGLVPYGPSLSGTRVSEETCLAITAVSCAVQVIAGTIAWLPLELYRRLPGGGKEATPEHPLHDLLKFSPNPETDKEVFWQCMLSYKLLYGNAYAEIERQGDGRPVNLWLIHPSAVQVGRDDVVGLYYEVNQGAGKPKVVLIAENMFHIRGPGDAYQGVSPIQQARESIGAIQAVDRFGASFFGNAARPGGVLTYPGQLSDQARENLRKSFSESHAGSDRVGRTTILEEGLTWQSITIPPEDGQFLQTKQFNVAEVGRIFNISPVFLHDLGRATWSNLETLNQSLVQMTLMPHLKGIESQIRRKLLPESERSTYYAEHKLDALLRGDTKSRYEAHKLAIEAGWKLKSEVRSDENLDPIPGLDDPPQPIQEKPSGDTSSTVPAQQEGQ